MSDNPPRWGQPLPDPSAPGSSGGPPEWTPPSGWSPQQPPAWPVGQAGPAQGPVGATGPAPGGWPQPGNAYPGQPGYQQPWQPGPGTPYPPAWAAPPQAPKPGIVPLRPLGVGELLDGALGLMRSNPRTVLGLAAAISAVSAILQTVGLWASFAVVGDTSMTFDTGTTDTEAALTGALTSSLVQLVPALMAGLLQIAASGLFIVLVGAAVLGRRLDAGQTWQLLRPRLLALIGLSVLLLVVGVLLLALVAGMVVLMGALLGGWGVAMGLGLALLALIALAYAYVRLSIASPILVMERRSPLRALARSWQLVRGSFWRVFGILILASIIVNVLTAVISVPFVTVSMIATASMTQTWPIVLATGLATLISGIVTLPFNSAVTGLLYTDLRIRREALDIELIAAGVDPTGDPLAPYRSSLR